MKKKTWFIIAAVLIIVAGGVFTLLRLTGGSHVAIDREPNRRSAETAMCWWLISHGREMASRWRIGSPRRPAEIYSAF